MSKYAKAIAAALTPIILLALARGAAWIGIDITFSEEKINELIVLAVTTAAVWYKRNAPT